jgi:hypothetical protein
VSESGILSTYAATLFALHNPLGMLPVFISYTTGLTAGVERWLALLVSVTMMALMLLFLLTGAEILDFFGVMLDSFRMAGGILLLSMGIQIVTGNPVQAAQELKRQADASNLGEAKSVYRQDRDTVCDASAGRPRRHRQPDPLRVRGAEDTQPLAVAWNDRRNGERCGVGLRDSADGKDAETGPGGILVWGS